MTKLNPETVAHSLERAIMARDPEYQAKTWEGPRIFRVYVTGAPKSKREWKRREMGYAEVAEDGTITGHFTSDPGRLNGVCELVAEEEFAAARFRAIEDEIDGIECPFGMRLYVRATDTGVVVDLRTTVRIDATELERIENRIRLEPHGLNFVDAGKMAGGEIRDGVRYIGGSYQVWRWV